jgi:hypothetical protein
LLWIGWFALDKLEFIAVPSHSKFDVFCNCGGGLVVKLLDEVGHIDLGVVLVA